jgi:2-oxoglutarate ferredoxin oxidoreductase subunit beta
MNGIGQKYLRKSSLPTLFCSGCGNGIILSAFLRAVEELDIIDKLALVGGIGCSGWIPVYVNADTIHTLHGRTIPVATGLKITDSRRKVVVFTGDGDCLAIGGNHFIHACRRNIDLTVVMVNNFIYGMTGGQTAPTSPLWVKTQSAPHGNPEEPFDACKLAIAAGATFVARWTNSHPRQLTKVFVEAIEHQGFSFVEVISQCPTQTGRYIKNGMKAPAFLKEFRQNSVNVMNKDKIADQEGRIIVGLLHKEIRLEFTQALKKLRKGN